MRIIKKADRNKAKAKAPAPIVGRSKFPMVSPGLRSAVVWIASLVKTPETIKGFETLGVLRGNDSAIIASLLKTARETGFTGDVGKALITVKYKDRFVTKTARDVNPNFISGKRHGGGRKTGMVAWIKGLTAAEPQTQLLQKIADRTKARYLKIQGKASKAKAAKATPKAMAKPKRSASDQIKIANSLQIQNTTYGA